MSWRILYIEESDSVSLYLDNVKIKKAANEFTFPLGDILLVMIDNNKLTITINLINACSKRNIPILTCGDNHHPLSIILPLNGHFEASKIFLDQLGWSNSLKQHFWQLYIKQKLRNQLFVLKKSAPNDGSIPIITKYIDEVEENDKTNREGLAAKIYFKALFGAQFSRHDSDALNASLDYGYSILRALISKVIISKGLNAQLGIFHRGAQNPFNLSDDVIEIFRPIIDLYVYQNFLNNKIFSRETRLKILEILNMKILYKDTKITLHHLVEKIVDEMIRFFKDGKADICINFDPLVYDL